MQRLKVVDRLRMVQQAVSPAVELTAKGRVEAATGLIVEVRGLNSLLAVGDRLLLHGRSGAPTPSEIVGFQSGRARAMPLGTINGLGPGAYATVGCRSGEPKGEASGVCAGLPPALPVSDGWLGRVVDPLGAPLDGLGVLPPGPMRPVRSPPPQAAARARLGPRLALGVRVLDLFTTCRAGQRLGLFAGSGIGKSTLLAMLAQNAACDVVVLALVGERGREVREFIEDDLGPALARSVVVLATSDQAPLLRREAAYAAMTIAEHFRDQGQSVLLLMDSVTRFCLALREIGLAAGEPPTTRGFPPSMFAELPCLLERAGPGIDRADGEGRPPGSITGLFTVLVEGDDHNEPVADAVRGILDGHAVLDRRIAESGRYPAVDVLRSLSRTVPGCLNEPERSLMREARAVLAQSAELSDLVRLGAYRAGTDAQADRALRLAPQIEALLQQDRGLSCAEGETIEAAFLSLAKVFEEVSHAA